MFKKILGFSLILVILLTPNFGVQAAENDTTRTAVVTQDSQEEVLAGLQPTLIMTTTYKITGNGVRLRSRPSLSGTILGTLYYGAMVTGSSEPEVTADGYVWQNVYSSTLGKWGWVAVAYLEEVG